MPETIATEPVLPSDAPRGVVPTGGVPPHALLWNLATIAAVSRALHVTARLAVADTLPTEGADVTDLAGELGVDADALGRVLRALAAFGVFEVDLPTVRHTDASLLLRDDHPMSMGPFAHMMGLPMCWDALTVLEETVTSGRAGVFTLDPEGLFSYLRRHPDQHRVFDLAMTAKSHADIACVLDAYDFGAHRTVVDVGGGRGHLLAALRARHPDLEAVLVELPEVVARVEDEHRTDGVHLVAADFFTDELPAADAYVLMEIIHDWDDVDAARILANVQRSAHERATVLIVETVLADGPAPDPATILDLVMLSVTGGRERTPDQYGSVLAAAGFELIRVIPTTGSVRIVEARAQD